jgi:DNA-binding response OmpR family regulator
MTETAAATKKRILVVDDTELFVIAMQELLEKEGFEVLTAKDGLEAIQTVKHELPHLDLVLLDLLLPQMTGFEVLKQIREGKLGKNLPVLVVTGVFKKAAQIDQLRQLGATGYMTKDQKPEEIVRRIKATLGLAPGGADAAAVMERPGPEELETLDRAEFLSRAEVFSGLEKPQLEKIGRSLEDIVLSKDEVVFTEGEEGDSFYIIARGSVRVVKSGQGKEEEVIAILETGANFGEMALVGKETRSATVISNDPVTLLRMKKYDFENLLADNRDLALVIYKNFVRMLSDRLRKTSESLTFSRSLLEELRKK